MKTERRGAGPGSAGRSERADAPKRSEAKAARGAEDARRKRDEALGETTGRTSSFQALRPGERGGERTRRHHAASGEATGPRRLSGNADDSIGFRRVSGNADDSIGDGAAQAGLLPTPRGRVVTKNTLQRGDGIASQGSLSARELRKATDGLGAGLRRAAERLSLEDPASVAVFRSSEFHALPASQRGAVVEVLERGGPSASPGMARLLAKGKAAVLQQQDRTGRTVLDNLVDLARSRTPALAGEVLADLAHPDRIAQGRAPTCTAATMQYELASERPREYAFLMRGLATAGSVRMAGGGLLTGDPQATRSASNRLEDRRSDSEALFQSAVMDFANGADAYDADRLESTPRPGQPGGEASSPYRGLFPEQSKRALSHLFGTAYRTKPLLSNEGAVQMVDQLGGLQRPNRPVLLVIREGTTNHMVTLDGLSDTHVRFRDPYTGDLRALPRDEFASKLMTVHYAEE